MLFVQVDPQSVVLIIAGTPCNYFLYGNMVRAIFSSQVFLFTMSSQAPHELAEFDDTQRELDQFDGMDPWSEGFIAGVSCEARFSNEALSAWAHGEDPFRHLPSPRYDLMVTTCF